VKLTLVFNLYQPPYQDEFSFNKAVSEFYIPLLKLLKNHKKINIVLNTPLSLLELMDREGYRSWITSVKELVEQGRIELVGSSAYGVPLSSLQDIGAQQQVILNEYALGYYFGRNQSFDGGDAVMVKDLTGFLMQMCDCTERNLMLLEELSYSYVIIDELESKQVLSSVKGVGINIVNQNISLKRLIDTIKEEKEVNDMYLCVINDGNSINDMEMLFTLLSNTRGETVFSNYITEINVKKSDIQSITLKDIKLESKPFINDTVSENSALDNIISEVCEYVRSIIVLQPVSLNTNIKGYDIGNIPIWIDYDHEKLKEDEDARKSIVYLTNLSKIISLNGKDYPDTHEKLIAYRNLLIAANNSLNDPKIDAFIASLSKEIDKL
jgi:hypothetical protein